jgi:hypothetical protein
MTVEEIMSKITPVLVEHDVEKASLFGSIVRGEDSPDSDIDIIVEFSGEKSLMDLAGLRIDLEELLGRKVDVLTFDSLHPLLKGKILAEQRSIF